MFIKTGVTTTGGIRYKAATLWDIKVSALKRNDEFVYNNQLYVVDDIQNVGGKIVIITKDDQTIEFRPSDKVPKPTDFSIVWVDRPGTHYPLARIDEDNVRAAMRRAGMRFNVYGDWPAADLYNARGQKISDLYTYFRNHPII